MGLFQDANLLAVLAGGSNPKWEELTSLDMSTVPPTFDATPVTGAPDSTDDGHFMQSANTLNALVMIDLRVCGRPPGVNNDTNETTPPATDVGNVHRRSAVFSITTFDATSEYTITIDGNVGTTGAQPYADIPAALAAIKAAVDAVASGVVTTALRDADGDAAFDQILIEGIAEADYIIDTVTVTATGAVDMIADPADAALRTWFSAGGVNNTANPRPPGWRLANNGDFTIADFRGFVERFEVAGLDRAYLETYDVIGVVGDHASVRYAYRVHVGPGIRPGQQ